MGYSLTPCPGRLKLISYGLFGVGNRFLFAFLFAFSSVPLFLFGIRRSCRDIVPGLFLLPCRGGEGVFSADNFTTKHNIIGWSLDWICCFNLWRISDVLESVAVNQPGMKVPNVVSGVIVFKNRFNIFIGVLILGIILRKPANNIFVMLVPL